MRVFILAAIHRDYRICANVLPKEGPAKFQKYLKHISWVISGTNSSKLSCNPRHRSRNSSCNHRHHLLQPSWRRIFSSSNNQKTRVDSDINSDSRASSFDGLNIWCRKWDTASFVRALQRKYWNALTVGRGHDDDGCSCNHRAVPPSEQVTEIRFFPAIQKIKFQSALLIIATVLQRDRPVMIAAHSWCHDYIVSRIQDGPIRSIARTKLFQLG